MLPLMIILVSALFQLFGIFDPVSMVVCALIGQLWLLGSFIKDNDKLYYTLHKSYSQYKPYIKKGDFFNYLFIGACLGSVSIAGVIMLMISFASLPLNTMILMVTPLLIETIKMVIFNRITTKIKNDLL